MLRGRIELSISWTRKLIGWRGVRGGKEGRRERLRNCIGQRRRDRRSIVGRLLLLFSCSIVKAGKLIISENSCRKSRRKYTSFSFKTTTWNLRTENMSNSQNCQPEQQQQTSRTSDSRNKLQRWYTRHRYSHWEKRWQVCRWGWIWKTARSGTRTDS